MAVILLSEKFHLNPDNLATPLAASIGDVVSISILSFIASILFDHISKSKICHFKMHFFVLQILNFFY